MTGEQIERMRKGLGSTAISTLHEDIARLLEERERLLEALRECLRYGEHNADWGAVRAALAFATAPAGKEEK